MTTDNKNKWTNIAFQSGTQIVTSQTEGEPHYYVYGGESSDDPYRYQVCKDLCKFLNYGERPSWIETLERMRPDNAVGENGIHITAVGPMILPPNDNGRLNWQTDQSEESKQKRERLIDLLFVQTK